MVFLKYVIVIELFWFCNKTQYVLDICNCVWRRQHYEIYRKLKIKCCIQDHTTILFYLSCLLHVHKLC